MVKLKKQEPAIEFFELIEELEKKCNFNFHDYAGKHSQMNYDRIKAVQSIWMEENGFGGKEHVLDKPVGSKEDWAKDSPEMADRIAINKGFRDKRRELDDEVPYLNIWHWLTDHDFCELRRGGINYIWLDEERLNSDDLPEHVKTVFRYIYEEVKDSEAYNGEMLACHVDW